MIGVDLVVDRVSRTPDRELARRVMNGMRDRGVLISTTGRDGNVLKIRPPLVITDEQATLIVTTLDEALTAASR
jgi:4-aminobutyrate aminotransferase-like enzyme